MTGERRGTAADATGPVDPFTADGDLEADRVRYARRLAQHSGSPGLDRLADLAARLLGAGSAQVSVISDVQTVVSGTGAAAVSVGEDSDAEDSLCTVTVRGGVPLRVEDAVTDERVRGLPPVTAGVVGSYLGSPWSRRVTRRSATIPAFG